MTRLPGELRRWLRREDGASTIELCFYLPIFVFVLMMGFEASLITLRTAVVERATDLALRPIRLNLGPAPDHDTLKAMICDEADIFIGDCADVLKVETKRIETAEAAWPKLGEDPDCVDVSDTSPPPTTIEAGAQNDMVLIRVCGVFKPTFMNKSLMTTLGDVINKDANDMYRVVAMSVFVVEPDS